VNLELGIMNSEVKKENVILKKSFEFALNIIEVYRNLNAEKEFILSKQLLRSGTSIGANVNESISAVSRKDFLNKLSTSLKEARETKYWLLLLDKSKLTKQNFNNLLEDIEEIIKILSAITKTTKQNNH
jgi:four helix bundle protein